MSFKPGTKFGLNIKKKETKSGFSAFGSSSSSSSSSRGAPIAARTNAFGALKSACAEEEEDDYPANNALRPEDRVNRELAVAQSTISHQTRLELQKAINEDPNVFDYDGSYDERKKRELALKKSREGDIGADGRKKAVHMEAMLKQAAARKQENDRYEQRKIQREREQEEDEFGDKEKFVTSAYKQRQAEIQALEEEERAKEALEQSAIKSGDMTGFYRNVLQMRERSNVDDIKLTDEQLAEIQQEALLKEQEEQGRLNTAIQAGVVAINDSGEVVDKRQQLMGGLNISSVKIKAIEREKEASEKIIRERREKERQEARLREEEEDRRRRLREQQQRARNMVQEQQSDLERQQQQVKEREKEDLARKMAKKATEDTISDAKARYLARKKEGGISKRNDDDSSSSDSE